jgi:peroxiredoxin family protein
VIVQAGGYDRVHYAFVLAAGAAATGRPATLFLTGRALTVLLPDPGWRGLDPADDGTPPALRDATLAERGVATLVELREACAELGVRLIACEMGWRALGHPTPPPPAPGLVVETAGVVTLLSETPPGHHLVFV